jgi:hypothetical protein
MAACAALCDSARGQIQGCQGKAGESGATFNGCTCSNVGLIQACLSCNSGIALNSAERNSWNNIVTKCAASAAGTLLKCLRMGELSTDIFGSRHKTISNSGQDSVGPLRL